MTAFKSLRYRLEYALVLLATALLRLAPLRLAQALGRGLGRAAFTVGVARATTLSNLEHFLGVADPAERRRIAGAAYAGFGQTMAELAWMPALDLKSLDSLFIFEGLEALEKAKAEGRGIVCMSAHFGNWEWMGAAFVRHGFPATLLIGTQSNPWVDALFNRYRERVGMKFVRIQSVRDSLRVLKDAGMVALLGDQDGDKWGTFAPFFGAQASTHSIGELLARRSGSLMVFGVPVRESPDRIRVTVHVVPPAPEGLGEAQGTAWVLAEYNRLLEDAIRRHPEHWLWMHDRWSSIPLHRLSGEPRARAERGEIAFDMAAQTWRDQATGQPITIEGWK